MAASREDLVDLDPVKLEEESARAQEEAAKAEEEVKRLKENAERSKALYEQLEALREGSWGTDLLQLLEAAQSAGALDEETAKAIGEPLQAARLAFEEADCNDGLSTGASIEKAKEDALKAQQELVRAKEASARAREEANSAKEGAAMAKEGFSHSKAEAAKAEEQAAIAAEGDGVEGDLAKEVLVLLEALYQQLHALSEGTLSEALLQVLAQAEVGNALDSDTVKAIRTPLEAAQAAFKEAKSRGVLADASTKRANEDAAKAQQDLDKAREAHTRAKEEKDKASKEASSAEEQFAKARQDASNAEERAARLQVLHERFEALQRGEDDRSGLLQELEDADRSGILDEETATAMRELLGAGEGS